MTGTEQNKEPVPGAAPEQPSQSGKAEQQPVTPPPSADELQIQVEEARMELAEFRDKYLRAAADLENTRRRAENELANARRFAIDGFASELLAVRDSLALACSVEIGADADESVVKMREGLELTLKQLDSAFAKFGIQEVCPQQGERLDPERHQAMTIQESSEVAANHILTVVQTGYLIHDRLLRPAMVIVAKQPASADAETTASEA